MSIERAARSVYFVFGCSEFSRVAASILDVKNPHSEYSQTQNSTVTAGALNGARAFGLAGRIHFNKTMPEEGASATLQPVK